MRGRCARFMCMRVTEPRGGCTMAERSGVSGRGAFRQQAINTANLLLEAADRLDNVSSSDSRTSSLTSLSTNRLELSQSHRVASGERAANSGVARPSTLIQSQLGTSTSGTMQSCATARERELRGLFNWTARSAVGGTGKRRSSSGTKAKSKKKKIPTWTHTYVCLAHPDDDTVPDSRERATLKLAGLGEKRFAVDVCGGGQEFYDELLFQYPKLRDGGGYELLRVPEGGGRDLEVIKVPEGGYCTEYLRAVVHSAKLFIRPLQKALDLKPQTAEVSITTTILMVLKGLILKLIITCPHPLGVLIFMACRH